MGKPTAKLPHARAAVCEVLGHAFWQHDGAQACDERMGSAQANSRRSSKRSSSRSSSSAAGAAVVLTTTLRQAGVLSAQRRTEGGRPSLRLSPKPGGASMLSSRWAAAASPEPPTLRTGGSGGASPQGGRRGSAPSGPREAGGAGRRGSAPSGRLAPSSVDVAAAAAAADQLAVHSLLVAQLEDRSEAVRMQAVWALGNLARPHSLAPLMPLLRDPSVLVVETAVHAVGALDWGAFLHGSEVIVLTGPILKRGQRGPGRGVVKQLVLTNRPRLFYVGAACLQPWALEAATPGVGSRNRPCCAFRWTRCYSRRRAPSRSRWCRPRAARPREAARTCCSSRRKRGARIGRRAAAGPILPSRHLETIRLGLPMHAPFPSSQVRVQTVIHSADKWCRLINMHSSRSRDRVELTTTL